jgi:hypothetical protein
VSNVNGDIEAILVVITVGLIILMLMIKVLPALAMMFAENV